jgi:hypothetical protein
MSDHALATQSGLHYRLAAMPVTMKSYTSHSAAKSSFIGENTSLDKALLGKTINVILLG